MSCRQTVRKTQKAHQPARINASALPVGVPTHSYYENSLSLLFFEQNSASFVVICSRRMQKRVGILYATHFLLLHYIIYSTVYSDERTQDSAIVLSIHLLLAGRKKNRQIQPRSEKWILSYSSSRVQRFSLCVYLATS